MGLRQGRQQDAGLSRQHSGVPLTRTPDLHDHDSVHLVVVLPSLHSAIPVFECHRQVQTDQVQVIVRSSLHPYQNIIGSLGGSADRQGVQRQDDVHEHRHGCHEWYSVRTVLENEAMFNLEHK